MAADQAALVKIHPPTPGDGSPTREAAPHLRERWRLAPPEAETSVGAANHFRLDEREAAASRARSESDAFVAVEASSGRANRCLDAPAPRQRDGQPSAASGVRLEIQATVIVCADRAAPIHEAPACGTARCPTSVVPTRTHWVPGFSGNHLLAGLVGPVKLRVSKVACVKRVAVVLDATLPPLPPHPAASMEQHTTAAALPKTLPRQLVGIARSWQADPEDTLKVGHAPGARVARPERRWPELQDAGDCSGALLVRTSFDRRRCPALSLAGQEALLARRNRRREAAGGGDDGRACERQTGLRKLSPERRSPQLTAGPA